MLLPVGGRHLHSSGIAKVAELDDRPRPTFAELSVVEHRV